MNDYFLNGYGKRQKDGVISEGFWQKSHWYFGLLRKDEEWGDVEKSKEKGPYPDAYNKDIDPIAKKIDYDNYLSYP